MGTDVDRTHYSEALVLIVLGSCLAGCSFSHSKQALRTDLETEPSPQATFINEEDSGLSIFGLLSLSEPDHYAVLLARAKSRFQCGEVHNAQLDFYTDHWLIVAFPIARITAVCEPVSEAVPTGGAGKPPTETSTSSLNTDSPEKFGARAEFFSQN